MGTVTNVPNLDATEVFDALNVFIHLISRLIIGFLIMIIIQFLDCNTFSLVISVSDI